MKRALTIISLIFALFSLLICCGIGYYIAVTKDTTLNENTLKRSDAGLKLYDKDGKDVTANLLGDKINVSMQSIPARLKQAFVSVEDKDFYNHNGVCFRRIVKAAMKNLTSFSFREGASTITQQLVKNTQLTSEKTIRRKLREFKLTRIVERRYSKEEIMQLYLNSIYFGHESFGVSHAAKFYFGKGVEELTLPECATLAALVKSPNRYSPFRDAEKCQSRRNFVLSEMSKQGYISTKEAEEAKRAPLPDVPYRVDGRSAYVGRIYEELSYLFPNAKAVDLNNLHVDTHLDLDLQNRIENLQTDSDFCVLIRDNHTHGLKAFSSSVGSILRTPASLIKPLLVYAPAVENNLVSPATPLLDEPIDFNGYCPSNYGGTYHGYVSARYALAHSVNVPAVKLLNTLGIERAAAYLEKMNLPVCKEDLTLALALGGMKEGFSLSDLADGYAIFSNGGTFSPSSAIKRICDEKGKQLFCPRAENKRIFSKDTCVIINDMLQTAVTEGTAKKLRALPFPIAAKTGTAGTSKGNTDAYTMAYTADDTVGVWLGNADNQPLSCTGGGKPADIALTVLKGLYDGKTPSSLPSCNDAVMATLDKEEYEVNHRVVLADDNAPAISTFQELFRKCALPKDKNSRFSTPTIEKPSIFVENGSICIQLCQTYYYDYLIERENNGEKVTVYQGKFRERIYDNSAVIGQKYVYSVTPFYQNSRGQTITLPAVCIPQINAPPNEWWE